MVYVITSHAYILREHSHDHNYNIWKRCFYYKRDNIQGSLKIHIFDFVIQGSLKRCKVSKVCNMLAKNNSDSEYYGRDLVTQNKK